MGVEFEVLMKHPENWAVGSTGLALREGKQTGETGHGMLVIVKVT